MPTQQRAMANSIMENYLSWAILWWCARNPDSVIKGNQISVQNVLKTRLPRPIINYCKLTSGREWLKKARAHGIGIHTQDEIIELGKSDLRVLSDLLFDKPIYGTEHTLLDVVALAILAQLQYISMGVKHPLQDPKNETIPKFVVLVTCLQKCALSDWEEMMATREAAVTPPKAVKDKEIEDKEGATLSEKKQLDDEPETGQGGEEEKEQETELEEMSSCLLRYMQLRRR